MTRIAVVRRLSMNGSLIALAMLCMTATCSARDASAIQGSIYIAGKTPIDPPANERKDTHAYLMIQGQGAFHMYRAMTVPAQDDACRGEGWKIKRVGHLACSISGDGKKGECDFAMELSEGTLAAGNPC